MKIGIICFTARGARLCRRLFSHFREGGEDCRAWIPQRFLLPEWEAEGMEPQTQGVREWAGQMFAEKRGMIFVGAVGIAVRAIAPWVDDKLADPPVAAVDEAGHYAVPLLSGHMGGANELARRISRLTGAAAVITTATDVNRIFAVDLFAVKNGLVLTDRQEAKAVSACLLDGEQAGFFTDFPGGECPAGLAPYPCRHNLWVTLRAGGVPDALAGYEVQGSGEERRHFLRLVPRQLVVGIGCRRGIDRGVLEQRVLEILQEEGLDPAGIKALATIDCKRDEGALLELAKDRGWELRFYSAQELACLEGNFSESEFVFRTVGVGNVCERAACAGGGRLIFSKRAGQGVTVCAALEGEVRQE